ncbi:transglycosylase SLT domain-containing protein [Planctobacterium marinum]|uniref:Lytic transglycosylase n=1 Tax=Planctobacterium marinum TaxID=1631968 RepID=A0AA48HRU7_9ALTE|nr:lytic transglycosylase [Planctobacterium marinum]
MRKIKSAIFLVKILLVSVIPYTDSVIANDSEQLREWFERAEQIAHRPNSSEYRLLKSRLKDYPLWPYVTYKTLLRYPYISNESAIADFLRDYAGTPMERPLRKKWLVHLARQKRGDLYLKHYRDVGDTSLLCQRIAFDVENNGVTDYLDEIQALWLHGKSQPNECDPLFKLWQEAGRRTSDIVLQRIELAADGGNTTLIPYLKRLLPESQKYLADLWLSVRRSPSMITRQSKFTGVRLAIETRILTYGLRRLIWRDEDKALNAWQEYSRKFSFSAEQKRSITQRFAIALASKNHPQAETWLERASGFMDEDVLRWHLTQVLREQNWPHALEILRDLPDQTEDELTYQYWEARALELLGNGEVAGDLFNQIAQNRHYYGFMASGKLGRKVNLQDRPFTQNQLHLKQLMAMPAMQRIVEFVKLGRKTSARREWNMFFPELSVEHKQLAAALASQWDWHDQAIHAFSSSGYLDDVAKRFPLAYKNDLINSAQRHDIDPAWAFAIARRESSFKPDARSGAGAYGLMQVLPSTVQYMEKRKIRARQLFDAQFNVEMGTQYMHYLMKRMDENTVLATASYNAGWHRVKTWIPEDNGLAADIWIETIPYRETRNYVKAVLAYKQIYHLLLGNDKNYFEDFAKMTIGGKGT